MGFNLDEYVDVAERIGQFYEKFPDGRLSRVDWDVREVGGQVFVIYSAYAKRNPEDADPGIGTAWEPFPGKTPYTKDSELMNAETAAWGRAIVACGIGTKKIASRQEVQARQGDAQASGAEPVSRPQDGSQVPERYVDCLRLAIRHKDPTELADADAWASMVGAATTKEEKQALVESLEAALRERDGDPSKVRERWESAHGKAKA